ncbi:MAG: N-acetylneuraminate synthase [Planctomycetes bacterium RBG_13_44_8b]|nr:MAG: N-acetylneuraminate synthase [Planctomycetes bacterium RBG_13_44_8b]
MKNRPVREIEIGGKLIGNEHPTYFIADIASNHDGDLARAKELIYLAARAGADSVKFQHFSAETIVSEYGFRSMGGQLSHQASWEKPVFEVYKDASLNADWTEELCETCRKAGIVFMTSPYSMELAEMVKSYVAAYKIGSGDITWHEIIRFISKQKKPVILATGAATREEVLRAVEIILEENEQIVLMQCNTNYTGSLDNFKYVNLRVLNTYKEMFGDIILGLSDHTPGYSIVLGAVAMGARVVEKHFTDNTNRTGPDHRFSMTPQDWKEMVEATRMLESAMGDGVKKIEENEKDSSIVQKRALRFVKDFEKGHILRPEDLFPLRPIPSDGLPPYRINDVVGKELIRNVAAGAHICLEDIK